MGSVRLNFPMESLDQWGDRLGLSKARRRRIEAIMEAAEKKPARMGPRCAKKGFAFALPGLPCNACIKSESSR